VPPGISDATVPNPIFNLAPVATVDEGNNWINLRWGPLSLTNPTVTGTDGNYGAGAPLGNYALASGSAAIDHVPNSFFNTVRGIVGNTIQTDFFGNPRPDTNGASVDVGAIEFQGVAAASLSVSPTSLVFPSTLVGATSASQNLTLTNGGGAGATGIALTFTGPFARITTGTFPAGAPNCGTTLAGNSACTIKVVYTASASGAQTGSVAIAASVTVTGSPVSLSGTGSTPTLTATVTPTTLAFGNWATGTTSNSQTVTVTNTGNTALAGGTFTFGGGTPQPFAHTAGSCGAALAVGANCTYTVHFTPATAATFSRTLTVAYTGATVTGSVVTLTGTGVATRAAVTVTPNPLTITDPSGTLTNSGTITFTNTAAVGGSNVSVTNVNVTGLGLIWAFTKGTDTCTGSAVAPGATCTVVVNFGRLGSVGTHTGGIAFTDTGATSPTAVLTGIAQ
jgi:hypothetical protein